MEQTNSRALEGQEMLLYGTDMSGQDGTQG